MQLAIIESGGKQYLVSPKSRIQVEKIAGNEGDKVKLDKVLLVAANGKFDLGKPFISGAAVEATIVKQARSKKVLVFKYKAKSKYRRKQGHRQQYTELEIVSL